MCVHVCVCMCVCVCVCVCMCVCTCVCVHEYVKVMHGSLEYWHIQPYPKLVTKIYCTSQSDQLATYY